MSFAFVDGPVFVGDGRVLDKASVLVEDGKITKVAQGEMSLGDNVQKISLEGGMLLPGLIDCHVHLALDGSPDPLLRTMDLSIPANTLMAAELARLTLYGGVTTVRDLGAPHGVDFALRDSIASGQTPGPRMLASGRVICMTGGHGWQMDACEADGPHEVRKAARQQIKAGADQVKLMATGGVMTPGVEPGAAQLTEEELRAGIEEAHKAGRKTATHAQGSQGIMNAVKAGIDSIEHGFFLTEEIVDLMIQKGVAFVPTVSAIHYIVENGVEAGIPAFAVEKAQRIQKAHKQSIMLAHDAGVMIGMGTDAGTPFNLHGNNASELALMAELGFSASDVICSATGVAARVLGLEDSLGVIEEGKLADLIVVQGDPLADVSLLNDPAQLRVIMQGGRLIKS